MGRTQVARRGSDGTLFTVSTSDADNKTYAGTSTDDGVTRKWSATAAFDGGHRPFPLLHENGTLMRVWHSRNMGGPPNGLGWKMYYTDLPLSARGPLGQQAPGRLHSAMPGEARATCGGC